jgi:hypothetical protein
MQVGDVPPMPLEKNASVGSKPDRMFSYGGLNTLFTLALLVAIFFPAVVALLVAIVEWELRGFLENVRKFGSLNSNNPANAIFVCAWIVLASFGIWNSLRHKSVRVNERGVTATLFGFPCKTILWKDMTKILKRVTYEYERGGIVETITFIGAGSKVSVRSYIKDYNAFKSLVNTYIDEFSILLEESKDE